MRQEVAEAVQVLRSHGDRHVHYIDGLEIFGPADARLLPDELHPNAEGYKLMGGRFVEKVAARFFV
jgi:lysophospholipase L1-like esterase